MVRTDTICVECGRVVAVALRSRGLRPNGLTRACARCCPGHALSAGSVRRSL